MKRGALQQLLGSSESPLAGRFPRSIPLKVPPGANPWKVLDHQMLVLVPFVAEAELRDAVQCALGCAVADVASDVAASAFVVMDEEGVSALQRFSFYPTTWQPILVPGKSESVMYSDLAMMVPTCLG